MFTFLALDVHHLCPSLSSIFHLEVQFLINANFWAESRLQLSGRLNYLAQPPEPSLNCSVEFVHQVLTFMKQFVLEKLL